MSKPILRRTDGIIGGSTDVLIALAPLCIFSCVHYGIRPLLLVLIGMGSAVLTEALCLILMRRSLQTLLDGEALVLGALIGCMLSPIAPFWMPAVAAVFGTAIVKMAFGGFGSNLFSPAAAGIALLTVVWDKLFFSYPSTLQTDAMNEQGMMLGSSLGKQLMAGGSPELPYQDVLSGTFPGPIGATAVLVLITCFAYLWLRHIGSPLVTLPYIGVCAVAAVLFPRGTDLSIWYSLLYELSSGYLLFAGVFLLNDPSVRPMSRPGRVMYGVIAGILVMLLRHFGRFEEGTCFAVMLANAMSPLLDRYGWKWQQAWQNRRHARGAVQ